MSVTKFKVTRPSPTAFVNSAVAAAGVTKVVLASAQIDNNGLAFGVIGEAVGTVQITTPAFTFGPAARS